MSTLFLSTKNDYRCHAAFKRVYIPKISEMLSFCKSCSNLNAY